MRAIDYALREAFQSFWRNRHAAAFAVLAIALAMIVLGALLVATWNIERLLAAWSSATEFSVFLRDGATSEERGAIEALIDGSGVVQAREYVSKADALTRFRREFAELAGLTEDFDDNPFPASVEVRIRPEAEADGRAEALVRRLAALPGVADVRYDREWLERVASGLDAVRGVGFALALVMAVAAAVTVATVVRLGMHGRRDELEVMALVGSPYTFIRGPFVAEGVLQGGMAALLALALLWVGCAAVNAWWGTELAALLDGGSIRFLPPRLIAALVAGGMIVGGAGGFTASRHAV
jgi:cell division transport system permease protein